MYLKSLILKGFKSFADRSVLALEPGITAIVGPNGSGKSNISDAVLWVLGERSARNLRGQAMEDIIFSGSAARKAVSVAEVDLVLDNSDHTLPVEFDEVVITRRMYRSGESEYLVNGVVSRRLDVLDILHDTGLGSGTHSIISQGSLDSILQSKPEDRRALIEEAAGVLKHKQRKEKSARKLASMDNHLARVRDVAAEVQRQLGPLERKAKRAEAYKEVSAQLADVKLALAVEELRDLQRKWEGICGSEKNLEAEVSQRRADVGVAEQRVNEIQELMKRESEDASELSRRQRRASNLAERLDGAEMLLRERRRAAIASEGDLVSTLEGVGARRLEAEGELSRAREALVEAEQSLKGAQATITSLSEEKRSLDETLGEHRERLATVSASIQQCDERSEEAKRQRDSLQESLANGLAHMKLVEARKVELSSDLERAQTEEKKASALLKEAQEHLSSLEEKHSAASKETTECFMAREQAQEAQDKAREALTAVESEISALKSAIRTFAEEDPALVWLLDNDSLVGGGLRSLSSSLRVEGSLEGLVEALLGADLSALAVKDSESAKTVASALADGGLSGDVSVIMGDRARPIASARDFPDGRALIDAIDYDQELAPVIEALLGDVVLCSDRTEAFAFQARTQEPLRFLSRDGLVLWPNGKARIFGARKESDEGVLARQRKLDEAEARRRRFKESFDEAVSALKAAEEAYRQAQGKSLQLSQELATHKGVCDSAATEQERTAKRLSSVMAEIEDIENQVRIARKTVDELRPEMDEAVALIASLAEERKAFEAQRDGVSTESEPLQRRAEELSERLAEQNLIVAKLDERKSYSDRMVAGRLHDIDVIEQDGRDARCQQARKRVEAERGREMLELLAELSQRLSARTRILDEALHASESATSSVHSDAATARDAARSAHDSYDEAANRMTQVQVEKSRLEVQVEAAVDQVVRECHTPLEVAEQLPPLEDRAATEDECFRLERRIKNMGTINPDAAEEYGILKERYDFLAGQLEDMEAARRSLNRIVRVIDNRMKDDFSKTFEQVNENFNEIFSLLFPGGNAHLSLEDPNDIENSGVEVTAQPRGKRLTKMMLMSGGEKSLTALALLFAVYKTRTTPFYILDEVEAALDDTNLRRLNAYIDTLRETTQLIMITHQRRTMEMADVLFGVSMQADGVTKVISQKLERALQHADEE